MPSLLMQCSKIADEPKNVRSRLGSKFSDRVPGLVPLQASLRPDASSQGTFQRSSAFTVPMVRSVPQPDLQTVRRTQRALACFRGFRLETSDLRLQTCIV
jgi:hypothetical protein